MSRRSTIYLIAVLASAATLSTGSAAPLTLGSPRDFAASGQGEIVDTMFHLGPSRGWRCPPRTITAWTAEPGRACPARYHLDNRYGLCCLPD